MANIEFNVNSKHSLRIFIALKNAVKNQQSSRQQTIQKITVCEQQGCRERTTILLFIGASSVVALVRKHQTFSKNSEQ